MHIVIVPDSFKGSLTARAVADCMLEAVQSVFPKATTTQLPFSDGGEGALTVLQDFTQGEIVSCTTTDPLGRPIKAPYFLFDSGQSAWIELSQSSGLTLLKNQERNPLKTSTYGTGLLIKDALKKGCTSIYLGIGGSATHDLGTGIFMALGGQLLDAQGKSIPLGGGGLKYCRHIDQSMIEPLLKKVRFRVACDVKNPLLGRQGAASTYAAQKGASPEIIEELEKNGAFFAELIAQQFGTSIDHIEGGGAAGGTAAGLVGLLGVQLESGFSLLSKLANLEEEIKSADLILTGEGHFDDQSRYGKVPFSVAELAKQHQKPTLILAGKVSVSKKEMHSKHLGVYAIKPAEMPLEEAMRRAPQLLYQKLIPILENFKQHGKLN